MTEPAVGKLIALHRQEQGLSQKELARKAKVGRSWLSVVELGRRKKPEREMLEAVAHALNVPAEVFLKAAGYRVNPVSAPRRRTAEEVLLELRQVIRREEEAAPILIPESEQAISAGLGAPSEPEYWPYWPGPGERGHDFAVIRVTGTCMEPRIREGERVVVDISASARPGDIVAAEHDGDRLVKRLEQQGSEFWLVALQEQPPIKVDERTRIIGVVRMVMHRP